MSLPKENPKMSFDWLKRAAKVSAKWLGPKAEEILEVYLLAKLQARSK